MYVGPVGRLCDCQWQLLLTNWTEIKVSEDISHIQHRALLDILAPPFVKIKHYSSVRMHYINNGYIS